MYLVISKWVTAVEVSNFSSHYLLNHSTLDIGVLGYIGIVWPKEHSPEVWSVPPGTLYIYIYTQVYTAIASLWKEEREQNITKLQCAFLQIHFLSNSSSSNLYCLMPLQNTSHSAPFQNFKQCISWVIFLWCEIPTVPLEYIIRAVTWLIKSQLHCSNYKWRQLNIKVCDCYT